MNIKRWDIKPLDKARASAIAQQYGIPSFLAMLLDIRGYTNADQIEALLNHGGTLADPYQLKDMDLAVNRIQSAIENFERIAIYGDYDADGVTATAILFSYLETVGADVQYYIPKRDGEGYGLNIPAVEQLAEEGVQLIITVDNGISSVSEVKRAGELKMDVVITDHHRPHEALPPAVAVVDPHRADCPSVFKELCGAGVVLKLLIAMENGDQDMILAEYADLAALGTIADIVSVTGENRMIIQNGMEILSATERPGLKALLEKSGCKGKPLTARTLAFTVVPRINATGRMGAPDRAVKLLSCDYEAEAESLAEEICSDNDARKAVETSILKEVIERIEAHPTMKYDRVLVIDGEDWHHGVVGIVAARVTDRYGKPTLIISRNGSEARGSGRSVEGFSLFEAVSACETLLTKFGGHPMAVGISLLSENVEELRININEYAKTVNNDMPVQVLSLDCKLNPASLSAQKAKVLSELEPFGTDNPYPLFGLYRMQINQITPVGGGGHLRLSCAREGTVVTAMCFGVQRQDFPYPVGALVDLAVTLEAREFRGEMQLTIQVKEIRFTDLDETECIRSYRLYEHFKRNERLTQDEAAKILPSRDELALLYRYLQTHKEKRLHLFAILQQLGSNDLNLGKLLVCLDIFKERALADYMLDGEFLTFTPIRHTGNKINIYESEIFAQIAALKEN